MSSWDLNRNNFDRNIAVVIGIDNYQNGIHPLKTAVNDASAIADILEEDYEYREVIRHSDFSHLPLTAVSQALSRLAWQSMEFCNHLKNFRRK